MTESATPVESSEDKQKARPPPGYDAFISYSHAVDGRLAPALLSALQRFAKPWYRLRALRIFRDEASLSANPALWSAIEDALGRSRWFILLASPTAASSHWVAREAEYWLADKQVDRLLIVLSEGDLVWDERRGRFDAVRTNALPGPLLTAFEEEPRWIDARWARSREQLTLRDPRFRAAVAELAAPIHDRPKDELIGEEIRQHRRTVRLARAAVAALAMLALAATVAAVLAIRGQNAARRERDRAEEQARLATSRQLAAQSDVALRQNELDLALLLAAHAFRLRDTAEAWDALVSALNAAPRLARIVHTPAGIDRAISADGRVVAVIGRDDKLHVRSLVAERRDSWTRPVQGEIVGLGISPEGNVVAVGDRRGAVTIHDRTRSGPPRRFPALRVPPGEEGPFQGTSFAFAPRGDVVAWNGAQISVWDGKRQRRLSPGVKPGSWLLAFGDRGRSLAAASDSDGTVVVWRLRAGRPEGREVSFDAGAGQAPAGFGEGVASIAFSPREPSLLAIGGFDGSVAFWDARSGKLLAKRKRGREAVGTLAFSEDGRFLVTAGAESTVWDVRRRSPVRSLPRYSAGGAVAFLPGSGRVATAGARTVAVWDLTKSPSQLARRLKGPDAGVRRVAYDSSGTLLATLRDGGAIQLWDSSTLRPVGKQRASGWQTIDVRLSPDGKTMASWRPLARPPLTLWGVDDGARHDVRGIPEVLDVAFTHEGLAVAATQTAKGIELWETSPPRRIRTLSSSKAAGAVHLASGAAAAAAPTARGAQITLWNAETGAILRRIPEASGVVGFGFSEDGRILATSNWRDATITLWDAKTGSYAGRLSGARAPDALAFDYGGRRLAALTHPDAIRLWQLEQHEARGSEGIVAPTDDRFEDEPEIAFAPDGRTLFVIGLGTKPLVFNVDERSWPTIACRLAGRDLTRAEWLLYVGPGFDYEPMCD